MYPWNIYTSFYFFLTSFIYQFSPRLSPWKYSTSWFSSFTIYYNYAVVVAVIVRFLVLNRVVPLVLILSAIPRNVRELMQVFFFYILKVLRLYGILNNFENDYSFCKSSPKRNSYSEDTFFKVWHWLSK